jgi:hypothetical protein
MWKYNDNCRLMAPMLRLPSQSLEASAPKGLNETIRRRVRRVAWPIDVEAADDLWIENKVASDGVSSFPVRLYGCRHYLPACQRPGVDVDQTRQSVKRRADMSTDAATARLAFEVVKTACSNCNLRELCLPIGLAAETS